jgi:putative ATPase
VLSDVVGQDHILGPDGALTRMLETRLAGLADVLGAARHRQDHRRAAAGGRRSELQFEQISAIFSGVADLKKVFEAARAAAMDGQGHAAVRRRDPSLQPRPAGFFLPVMEDGTVTLVGATTENPSFELNAALLSRARVLVFQSLDEPPSRNCSARAEKVEGRRCRSTPRRAALVRMADGDGRAVLTLAEEVWRAARPDEIFDAAQLQDIVQRRAPIYDKAQDGHYNLISALHKSVRGSDPDAALYYLAACSMPARIRCSWRAGGADGGGGHRPCRSAGAGHLQCRQGRL